MLKKIFVVLLGIFLVACSSSGNNVVNNLTDSSRTFTVSEILQESKLSIDMGDTIHSNYSGNFSSLDYIVEGETKAFTLYMFLLKDSSQPMQTILILKDEGKYFISDTFSYDNKLFVSDDLTITFNKAVELLVKKFSI